MHRGDAPPAAVASANAALVEIGGDRLDTHRAAVAVTRAPAGRSEAPVSAWIGSISSFFLIFAPRCSAATVR